MNDAMIIVYDGMCVGVKRSHVCNREDASWIVLLLL